MVKVDAVVTIKTVTDKLQISVVMVLKDDWELVEEFLLELINPVNDRNGGRVVFDTELQWCG